MILTAQKELKRLSFQQDSGLSLIRGHVQNQSGFQQKNRCHSQNGLNGNNLMRGL